MTQSIVISTIAVLLRGKYSNEIDDIQTLRSFIELLDATMSRTLTWRSISVSFPSSLSDFMCVFYFLVRKKWFHWDKFVLRSKDTWDLWGFILICLPSAFNPLSLNDCCCNALTIHCLMLKISQISNEDITAKFSLYCELDWSILIFIIWFLFDFYHWLFVTGRRTINYG